MLISSRTQNLKTDLSRISLIGNPCQEGFQLVKSETKSIFNEGRFQARSQGLSSLPPLSSRRDNGGREERPWERGWDVSLFFMKVNCDGKKNL